MKRILSVLVMSALLLTMLAACGNQPDETTPVATTPAATTPADTTPVETTPAQTEPSATTPTTPPAGADLPTLAVPAVDYPADLPELPGMEPLSEDKIREIAEAWYAKEGYALKWFNEGNIFSRHFGWRYYGTAEEGIVLYRPTYTLYGWHDENEIFRYHMTYERYVYREGEFYTFEDAEVSEETVAAAEWYHKVLEETLLSREDRDDPYVNDGTDLPPLEACPYTAETLAKWGIAASDQYLGTYNGCIVVEENRDDFIPTGYFPQAIAGKIFCAAGDRIYVYGNGERYSLADAFERGYLTVADVAAIAYYYQGPVNTHDVELQKYR